VATLDKFLSEKLDKRGVGIAEFLDCPCGAAPKIHVESGTFVVRCASCDEQTDGHYNSLEAVHRWIFDVLMRGETRYPAF
jgi:hypothetical protein